jgi:hypothetical protein
MLVDQQNQYCEHGYTTKTNLHVPCNLYQDSNDILHRDRKINPQVHVETQKALNSKSNPEQKRSMLEVLQQLMSSYTIKP